MGNDALKGFLVQRGVRQHGPDLDKQPQQVDGAVHLGHGRARVVDEYLAILRPFKFVEKLRSEGGIEVFFHAFDEVRQDAFLLLIVDLAGFLVSEVIVYNLEYSEFGGQDDELLLPRDDVPVVHEPRF